MKKLKIVVLMLSIFLTCMLNVKAECSLDESSRLNALGANVHVDYELAQGVLDPEMYSPPEGLSEEELANYQAYYDYFKINISNVTEDLYVIVYNDIDKISKTYTYSDAINGVISFDWENVLQIANFTITVYSSNKTNCPDTKLYTHYLSTPKYNEYSSYALCDNNKDFYLCYDYLTVNTVPFEDFAELIESYEKGKIDKDGNTVEENDTNNSFATFVKEHGILIAGTVLAIVLAGGLITVVIVRKQRSRIV